LLAQNLDRPIHGQPFGESPEVDRAPGRQGRGLLLVVDPELSAIRRDERPVQDLGLLQRRGRDG
jgi:hypothetical protein